MAKKPRKKFDTGEGNLEMIKNSVTAIKHHADELTSELKKNPEIEAWVLAKVDRAAQNLSDVTHYLDGEMNKFAKGGKTPIVRTQFEEEEFEYAKGGVVAQYRIIPFEKYETLALMNPSYELAFNVSGTFDEAIKKAQEYVLTNGIYAASITKLHPSGKALKNKNVAIVTKDKVEKYANGGMARGGGISDAAYKRRMKMFGHKPYGATKGKFKVTYNADGEPQTEIWDSMEMAKDSAKRYSRIDEFSDVKIFDESGKEIQFMARGGEPKPSSIPDYSKISSVEVDGIDTNDAPDFVDAYITYAEYDGEPMTDEQIEELNQDGDFVYDAVINHLYADGGKIRQNNMADGMMDEIQFDRNINGSLYDRGRADSYYGRAREPHWYPNGTYNGEKFTELTKKEIEEYNKGYNENTDFKDYGEMAKGGKIIGKQKKLDLNKNGKLDTEDFKMLRKKRKKL